MEESGCRKPVGESGNTTAFRGVGELTGRRRRRTSRRRRQADASHPASHPAFLEEEKILKEIKQKVRENFYQITQYVMDEMIDDGIWTDNLRRAVENPQVLGTFEGRYTKGTMPGYEKTEGYLLWGFDSSESREIRMDCQILDSGKLRIIGVDTKFRSLRRRSVSNVGTSDTTRA